MAKATKLSTSEEFTHFLRTYQTVSDRIIEDGLDESDWDGFAYQTKSSGRQNPAVGDDLS
ncbi:hypothetical protein ACNKHT_17860 [Shigella flexneri]